MRDTKVALELSCHPLAAPAAQPGQSQPVTDSIPPERDLNALIEAGQIATQNPADLQKSVSLQIIISYHSSRCGSLEPIDLTAVGYSKLIKEL